jgi:hypothetical protein
VCSSPFHDVGLKQYLRHSGLADISTTPTSSVFNTKPVLEMHIRMFQVP